MRNYMKKRKEEDKDLMLSCHEYSCRVNRAKRIVLSMLGILILIPLFLLVIANKELNSVSMVSEANVSLASSPIAATTVKKGVINIPTGRVNANPFVPYRDLGDKNLGKDLPPSTLIEPPTTADVASDAVRVMDTIVSGILFDKYSPSAILNIEGNDYLVKKGDVVNNYEVLSILPDSVTVKLGANVYKAGIGEILTEGTLNHNEVSNLNNKFGGIQ